MRNIKLTIEYDGTDFCGWLCQPKKRTVMGELQKAIKKLTGEIPKIEYCSRTDSGVHAYAQVANFSTHSKIPAKGFQKGLNSILPDDISIIDSEDASKDFNARFDAKAKTYKYVINDSGLRHPISVNQQFNFKLGRLDVTKMRSAAKHLIGTHDFTAFGANDGEEHKESPIKTIMSIRIERKNELIHIYVKGGGFLYKMVRSIAGALIGVGRGRLDPKDIKKILESKNRSQEVFTAPAHGLFLLKIIY